MAGANVHPMGGGWQVELKELWQTECLRRIAVTRAGVPPNECCVYHVRCPRRAGATTLAGKLKQLATANGETCTVAAVSRRSAAAVANAVVYTTLKLDPDARIDVLVLDRFNHMDPVRVNTNRGDPASVEFLARCARCLVLIGDDEDAPVWCYDVTDTFHVQEFAEDALEGMRVERKKLLNLAHDCGPTPGLV